MVHYICIVKTNSNTCPDKQFALSPEMFWSHIISMISATFMNNILVIINSKLGNNVWVQSEGFIVWHWNLGVLVSHVSLGGSIWHGFVEQVVCQRRIKASADNPWMLHEERNVSWNKLDETVLYFLNFSTAKQHLPCICICARNVFFFLLLWWPHTLRPGNNINVCRALGEVNYSAPDLFRSNPTLFCHYSVIVAFLMLTSLPFFF